MGKFWSKEKGVKIFVVTENSIKNAKITKNNEKKSAAEKDGGKFWSNKKWRKKSVETENYIEN